MLLREGLLRGCGEKTGGKGMARPKKNWNTRYKCVREELDEIFSELDEKTQKITVKLLDNAAFMALKLEDLQAEINQNGMSTKTELINSAQRKVQKWKCICR